MPDTTPARLRREQRFWELQDHIRRHDEGIAPIQAEPVEARTDGARIAFDGERLLKFITEDLELELEPWQRHYIQHYFDNRDGRATYIARPR